MQPPFPASSSGQYLFWSVVGVTLVGSAFYYWCFRRDQARDGTSRNGRSRESPPNDYLSNDRNGQSQREFHHQQQQQQQQQHIEQYHNPVTPLSRVLSTLVRTCSRQQRQQQRDNGGVVCSPADPKQDEQDEQETQELLTMKVSRVIHRGVKSSESNVTQIVLRQVLAVVDEVYRSSGGVGTAADEQRQFYKEAVNNAINSPQRHHSHFVYKASFSSSSATAVVVATVGASLKYPGMLDVGVVCGTKKKERVFRMNTGVNDDLQFLSAFLPQDEASFGVIIGAIENPNSESATSQLALL